MKYNKLEEEEEEEEKEEEENVTWWKMCSKVERHGNDWVISRQSMKQQKWQKTNVIERYLTEIL